MIQANIKYNFENTLSKLPSDTHNSSYKNFGIRRIEYYFRRI